MLSVAVAFLAFPKPRLPFRLAHDQTATRSLGSKSQVSKKSLILDKEPMLDLREVFSLTDFLRNHRELVSRLTESRKPLVLTVKGKPALVIQDAGSYQELLDRLERAERRPSIDEGR